ncbi:MAG: aldo/keto reductase, partial [Terrimicrobiaceae bacterium]
YQLHAPDPVTPFDASVETLAKLQAEGKIRFVALSNVTKEHIEENVQAGSLQLTDEEYQELLASS